MALQLLIERSPKVNVASGRLGQGFLRVLPSGFNCTRSSTAIQAVIRYLLKAENTGCPRAEATKPVVFIRLHVLAIVFSARSSLGSTRNVDVAESDVSQVRTPWCGGRTVGLKAQLRPIGGSFALSEAASARLDHSQARARQVGECFDQPDIADLYRI